MNQKSQKAMWAKRDKKFQTTIFNMLHKSNEIDFKTYIKMKSEHDRKYKNRLKG